LEAIMNKSINRIAIIAAIAAAALVLGACAPEGEANVILSAALAGGTPAPAASRAVTPGDAVTTVDAYRVVFTKVEIGNSEEDKFTLWESADGETMDVAAALQFSGVQPVPAGTYAFVRLTIGPVLSVDGSIDDAGTLYAGTGSVTLDKVVYVWGNGLTGASALASPVVITDGCEIAFSFDVADTVTYQGGPADAALLSVVKPVLDVEVR
jgi:hypothetical protein